MKQYLLSVYHPETDPPEDVDAIMRDVDALNGELRAAGAWVLAGGLHRRGLRLVTAVGFNHNGRKQGPEMGIEFGILGPLGARVVGVAVAVGGPRQRALLAMPDATRDLADVLHRAGIEPHPSGRRGPQHRARVQL
jgi:hypothetical protein